MSTAPNDPTERELGHLQGNVSRLRALFSSPDSNRQATSPVHQLRRGGGVKDHSPSPFQAARVSLQNIEEDLNSIHGLLSTPSSSRDGVSRLCRSVSPATPKLCSIQEPCASSHEMRSMPMSVAARANGGARSSTSSSQQACDRLSDIRPWNHSKERSSPGPRAGGSSKRKSPSPPTQHTPPSSYIPRRRFLSLSEEELTAEKYASSADSSYSIRVDFGMSIHDSLHRPKDANSNSLTHAIDTLLMVTGNGGMSARNVEEHVKEQTRMMQGQDQSNDPIVGTPDVQSAGEVVQSLHPQHLHSGPTAPSIKPDLVLSVASTTGSTDDSCEGSGSSTSTVHASPQPGLGDVDGSNATRANDCLSYRPPSVRSLPASYLAPVRATCHCPYCCSCGSHQKQLDTFSSHHTGLHQRSPSIQSVPVYLEGTGPDISLARRSRNCPLQRFFHHSTRPSPSCSTVTQRYSNEQRSSHSSIEDLPQMRSSVKELAQSFERLATGAQGLAGSELSLCSVSTASGTVEPQHARLRHTSDHQRSPSLVSVTIPEESLSGPASHNPLCSTAVSTPVMGSGNLLQMADSSVESLPSLSSQRTNISMDPLYFSGQNLRVGVDGRVFRDRMEMLHSWYKDFSDQQRNGLLSKLLDWSNCSQMRHLSLQMEPILHQHCPHNCQDLLSWLPPSISYQILLFLDPVSLCRCLLVSRQWYSIASNSQLWRNLCRLEKYQLSPQGQKKQLEEHTLADGSVQWKEVFAERYRLWRNWSCGYCNIRTFEGHTQGVSCVQFDDNRIVSGSSDKTIKVWNIRTNTTWAALTLEGHSGDVRCLHLHGNRLISGSSDRTIKVWELFTENVSWLGATCRVTMVGHTHTVRCLQSDDDRIISGSYDHTLKIWGIATGTCRHTLRGHTDHVLCVQFKDNKLVSGSGDCTIIVWDLSTYEMKRTLRGHKAAVTTLQFDSSRIISGSLDRLIKIWDLSTWQCVHTLDWIHSEGHTGVIRHLQANHWKMVSAADDKTLKVWSLDSGERLLTLRSHTDGVTCVQFNDKVIVSGSYDKTVKLWDFSAC